MSKKTVDKIQISLKPCDWQAFKWQEGPTVQVNPHISLENKLILFKTYAGGYFRTDDFVDNYINAKYTLILGITDLCTNINVEKIDINALLSSGLWDEIKSRIENYAEVTSDLYNIVKLLSEQRLIKHSMGVAFDKLADYIINFINSIDLSPEGIEKLTTQLQEASQDFDEKYKGTGKTSKAKKAEAPKKATGKTSEKKVKE